MESLGEAPWDAVICGTGLQQSLLALALSRSNKRILHLDPNEYYGQHEAAFSLQEADSFAAAHALTTAAADAERSISGGDGAADQATTSVAESSIFRNASVWKHAEAEAKGLSFSRAYTLALAPQIIHTRSKLLAQLVSSRAYRQIEFLAVGSFFVYELAHDKPKLSRIPSSREDVFSSQSIPARSKRSLMKFLKFVVDYDSDDQKSVWEGQADTRLTDFLTSQFKLDDSLRTYILALTLTLDGNVSVKDGLAIINRHLTSMGLFGPGFCAVYPKWGGLSEIAQVGCRAGAVGGGIYMLGTDMHFQGGADKEQMSLKLSNDVDVRTKTLATSRKNAAADAQTVSRLVAVVDSPLKSLFEILVEGAPTPVVAVVAFPSSSDLADGEQASDAPVYAMVHSSETGECPNGQCVIYLTTLAEPGAKQRLNQALDTLLQAVSVNQNTATSLYQLYYEQSSSEKAPLIETHGSSTVFSFASTSQTLAFDDSDLDAVKSAWTVAMGSDVREEEYLIFEDREGADVDDDVYD
ncbi:GDP dissociation inhibitor [Pseudomassariella vexata]|uniref:Rab proteins geranylgeranyltransferase n=1 Tax=Pseudomassariella vexata TaxID=1141098 RepID=A0A1Y2E7T7_9PEZI|nr:GDP dissociation inhibitor [Pseudomassariella vexata]ORY67628.1 GDP dissociation inhibitor [Pseudomassariella vexata]